MSGQRDNREYRDRDNREYRDRDNREYRDRDNREYRDRQREQGEQRPQESTRQLAYRLLMRIEHEGAYANLVLGPALERSNLPERDRRFVTELVYGATRMRRACEFAVDRFLLKEPQAEMRTLLSLGAYQLLFAGVPPHAAVSATVDLAPEQARGFVNAVLRKVASVPCNWPGPATELSYPEWIVRALADDLGARTAHEALAHMNTPPSVHERDDGYIQDLGSQMVVDAMNVAEGALVLDACAAPGGKATLLASRGALVVATDVQASRVGLIRDNAESTGQSLAIVGADASRPPFARDSFDVVLLDAPCSGLGVLRRRADARWRITPTDVAKLAALQQKMIDELAPLVKPGGTLVYSVCTMLDVETVDHRFPDEWEPIDPPGEPWTPCGPGAARLLPQTADTDGMTLIRYRRPS